jgi:hypothetical protein
VVVSAAVREGESGAVVFASQALQALDVLLIADGALVWL